MSVVICNGTEEKAILNITKGKQVGTFFTTAQVTGTPVELQAMHGEFLYSILSFLMLKKVDIFLNTNIL